MAYSQSHAAAMKEALDEIGAALGCEGNTTKEQMLEAIADRETWAEEKVNEISWAVKKKVQAKADKKLDEVKAELDEVKADLSKSWATISDLKEQNEKLNAWAISTLQATGEWTPTEEEAEEEGICPFNTLTGRLVNQQHELEKVKDIARRQSKWIVNAKQVIKMYKEDEDEEYCAKYCRCGTAWSPDFRDNPKVADGVYCKKCSGGEEETFYFSCDEEGYTFFDDANSLIKNTPRMEDCYVFVGDTTKERIEEDDDDYKEVNVEEYLADNK